MEVYLDGGSECDGLFESLIDDELIEIRPANTKRSQSRVTLGNSITARQRDRPSRLGGHGCERLNTNLPTDGVCFFGPDSQLDLGWGLLKRPLVYATGSAQSGNFDASLIDSTLPVAPPGSAVAEKLPYWPNYYDCSPAQRSRYLDWLLAGKCDPNIELGYVYIYFYGLERRVLVDRADYLVIAQELIRLLAIYGSSKSFRRYAPKFLWLTLFLASQSGDVSQSLFDQAIEATLRWNNDLLGICLAVLHNNKRPLPCHVAYLVCQNDSRAPSSAIIKRHQDEFLELFETRYRDQFGDGLRLRAAGRAKQIEYHPASNTLFPFFGAFDSLDSFPIPDVLAISSQFNQLVELWKQSIAELRAQSPASKSSGGKLNSKSDGANKSQPVKPFQLDMQEISRITADTRQVASLLRDAMADVDEPEGVVPEATVNIDVGEIDNASVSISRHDTPSIDLDPRFRPFLSAILAREEWTPQQLRELAAKRNVMLNGAVEAINDWSMDRYGDWLIEDGDTYHVRKDLIKETL